MRFKKLRIVDFYVRRNKTSQKMLLRAGWKQNAMWTVTQQDAIYALSLAPV
jgi:hypothetical protein